MALEWLKTILGTTYTEDIDKKVSDEIGKGFVARADFNAVNDQKKKFEADLKDRDTQLDSLKKLEPEKLQGEITRLQNANKAAQDKYDTDLKLFKRDTAIETRLIKEGAVNPKAVKALLDGSKISLDGDNLVGLDEQLKALKESEKWAFSTLTPAAPPKSGVKQNPAPTSGGAGEKTAADEILAAVYGNAN